MLLLMLLTQLPLISRFISTWSAPCRPRGLTWTGTSCAPWSGSWGTASTGGAGSWTGNDVPGIWIVTYALRAFVRYSFLHGPCCLRFLSRRGPWRRPWRPARPPSQWTRNQEVVSRPSCSGSVHTWRRRPRGHTFRTRQTSLQYRFCSLCPNQSVEPF